MPLFVADERGLKRDGALVGAPCFALDARDGVVWAVGQTAGERLTVDGARVDSLIAPPGASRVVLGKYLYVLSADADSVTAYDGDLRVALTAPAGDYPRDLQLSGDKKRLLVAGGASGTAILMDESLRVTRTLALPGMAGAACFTSRGIAALCGLPGEDMRAALVFARGATVETVRLFDGAACALCALPGGDLMIGVTGEIVRLRGARVLYRLPSPCPARIRPCGNAALVVDICEGTVRLIDRPPGRVIYRGAPNDAIMI